MLTKIKKLAQALRNRPSVALCLLLALWPLQSQALPQAFTPTLSDETPANQSVLPNQTATHSLPNDETDTPLTTDPSDQTLNEQQQINTQSITPTTSQAPAQEAPHPPTPQHAKPPAPKRLWNLQHANIRAVIQAIAQDTGRNFIIDPRVQGKISIVSNRPITPTETYQMFLSALQVLGYSAIPTAKTGNIETVKIVPDLSARTLNTPISSPAHPGQGDEWVVRVIYVRNVPVGQLVPVLRPLMPSWSNISAYLPTNTLILAGRAGNINRLSSIIHQVDEHAASQIQVIPLHYASADKLLSVLHTLQHANRMNGQITPLALAADNETNSIVISGNPVDRLHIRVVISQLDIPGPQGFGGNTKVFHLNYLKAKQLAPILAQIAHAEYVDVEPGDENNTDDSGNEQAAERRSLLGNRPAATSHTVTQGTYFHPTGNPAAGNKGSNTQSVSIQAESNNNAIIITAPPTMMHTLTRIIHTLDKQPDQVLVQAIIAQVDERTMKRLGITWGTNENAASEDTTGNGYAESGQGFQAGAAVIRSSDFSSIGFLRHTNIQVILAALKGNVNDDILSTPTVVVVNNKKAEISVGKEISIQNREYAGNGGSEDSSLIPFTTFTRKNVDLILKVTPQISPNRQVRLNIEQTNDSLQDPESPTTTPVENTSKIKTTVMVKSGDVLILGGLQSHDYLKSVSKIPILGDIPILGKLFTSKNHKIEKRNLVIFLRPIIMSNAKLANQLTNLQYDQIRQQELYHWHNNNLTDQYHAVPVLPRRHKPRLKLPSPYGHDA